MKRASAAQSRLAFLLILFSLIALAVSFGGAALLDRDARRLRAGEAARFDMEALTEKLKGAAEDPSAGPLLTAAIREIARYSGPASGRIVRFEPAGTAPYFREKPLADGLVLLARKGEPVAVGLRRDLPAGRLTVGRQVQASGPLRFALVSYALVTAALLLGLSALAAWLVGRLFTARIATLNRVCSEVEAGNVGARLEDKGNDEIALLSGHLNRMLGELERRMSNLRASSDRIAHDLRTPLARLGSRLSMLAGMPPAEHAAQIAAAQREIGNLIEAFNGLLDLREIETESGLSHTRFDLAEAVEDAVELYDAVAEDQQGIAIERRLTGVEIHGVPALLTRAVANLIDNALHAAPPGSVITVATYAQDGAAVVEVRDTGKGPPSQVVHALGDDISHTSGWGGHGVGLSIVAAVARRHGGSFSFAREAEETVARLRIPLQPES